MYLDGLTDKGADISHVAQIVCRNGDRKAALGLVLAEAEVLSAAFTLNDFHYFGANTGGGANFVARLLRGNAASVSGGQKQNGNDEGSNACHLSDTARATLFITGHWRKIRPT